MKEYEQKFEDYRNNIRKLMNLHDEFYSELNKSKTFHNISLFLLFCAVLVLVIIAIQMFTHEQNQILITTTLICFVAFSSVYSDYRSRIYLDNARLTNIDILLNTKLAHMQYLELVNCIDFVNDEEVFNKFMNITDEYFQSLHKQPDLPE